MEREKKSTNNDIFKIKLTVMQKCELESWSVNAT